MLVYSYLLHVKVAWIKKLIKDLLVIRNLSVCEVLRSSGVMTALLGGSQR